MRTGFVKVSQARPGGDRVLNYVGPGGIIGEIGVLSEFPELRDLAPAGIRTATCTALDHVDLIRIDQDDFRAILNDYPAVRPAVIDEARRRLQFNSEMLCDVQETPLADFLGQGLMNAKKLLVLDLEKCTRCDECTKACADTHHGAMRLIREGLRFDKFLVASSCRSCLDPDRLVGCPVGSISRSPKGEINIADSRIGCGLCARIALMVILTWLTIMTQRKRPMCARRPRATSARAWATTTSRVASMPVRTMLRTG